MNTYATPWNFAGLDLAHWTAWPTPDPHGLRRLAVDFDQAPPSPILIAYATDNYLPAALNLKEDCLRLKIPHDIAHLSFPPAPHQGTTRQIATRLKRGFIACMLAAHRRPVWFVDVDSRLRAAPPKLDPHVWLAVHYQPERKQFPIRSSVLYLAPGPKTNALLLSWHAHHGPHTEDHTPLVAAWHKLRPEPGIARLDSRPWFISNGTPIASTRAPGA